MKRLTIAAALVAWCSVSARAETTICNEIPSIPFTITTSGTWCLKKDLASSLVNGSMIMVNANSVVIDLNEFKLGGLGAGSATNAIGINLNGRKAVEVRNGTVRGFLIGIDMPSTIGGLVDDVLLDENTAIGIRIASSKHTVVRNSRILSTGKLSNRNFSAAIRIQQGSEDTLVERNFIGGVSNPTEALGIEVSVSSRSAIRDNVINFVHGPTTAGTIGVKIGASAGTLVRRNDFMNADRGSAVSADSGSTKSGCVENSINGYSVGVVNCIGQ